MALEILTLDVIHDNAWHRGDDPVVTFSKPVLPAVPWKDVRCISLSISGGCTLVGDSPLEPGRTVAVCGSPSTSVTLEETNGHVHRLSGPLWTPVQFSNITGMTLLAVMVVGNPAFQRIRYALQMSAQLLYEASKDH